MSIRVTLIAAISALEQKHKGPVDADQIKEYLGIEDARVNGNLWQIAKEGLAKIAPKASSTGKNMYLMNPAGKEYLKKNVKKIFTNQEVQQWSYGDSKLSSAKSAPTRYGTKALSAIDGIAALVDQNEALTIGLRSIRSQIDNLLKEQDNNEQPGS